MTQFVYLIIISKIFFSGPQGLVIARRKKWNLRRLGNLWLFINDCCVKGRSRTFPVVLYICFLQLPRGSFRGCLGVPPHSLPLLFLIQFHQNKHQLSLTKLHSLMNKAMNNWDYERNCILFWNGNNK